MHSNSDQQHQPTIVKTKKNIAPQKLKKENKPEAASAYVKTTYINRVACPLHIIELKKAINSIEISKTLRIIVGNHAVTLELLSACQTLGHKTMIVENNGHEELLVTRKN